MKAIEVTCACGQRYQVKVDAAGKKFRCQKCQEPVVVPTGQNREPPNNEEIVNSDLFGDAPSLSLNDMGADFAATNLPTTQMNCPSCHSYLQPNAVLCINCGYNTTTGERVATERDSVAGEVDIDVGDLRRAIVLFGIPLPLFGVFMTLTGIVNDSAAFGFAVGVPCIVTYMLLIALVRNLTSVVRIDYTPERQVQIVKSTGVGHLLSVSVYQPDDYDSVLFVQKTAARRVGVLVGFILLLAFISGLCMMGLSTKQSGLIGLMEVIAGLIVSGAALRALLRRPTPKVTYRVDLRRAGQNAATVFCGGADSKQDADAISRLIENATSLSREEDIGLLETGKLGL